MQTKDKDDVEVERYLRETQLLERYLPFSGPTLWRKVRTGDFPAPVKLGPTTTTWREREAAVSVSSVNTGCIDWIHSPLGRTPTLSHASAAAFVTHPSQKTFLLIPEDTLSAV
jgi:prophage regulatory protein